MAKFYLRGEHCDGVSFRLFDDEKAALAALANKLGGDTYDGEPLAIDKTYVDGNGGTRRVSFAPAGITTARQMEALERAYDARECGTLTAAQRKLLDRVEY